MPGEGCGPCGYRETDVTPEDEALQTHPVQPPRAHTTGSLLAGGSRQQPPCQPGTLFLFQQREKKKPNAATGTRAGAHTVQPALARRMEDIKWDPDCHKHVFPQARAMTGHQDASNYQQIPSCRAPAARRLRSQWATGALLMVVLGGKDHFASDFFLQE